MADNVGRIEKPPLVNFPSDFSEPESKTEKFNFLNEPEKEQFDPPAFLIKNDPMPPMK